MGLLDGDLAKQIFAGFKGLLLKGKIRQEIVSGVDANGDPITSVVETAIEGFLDEYSAFYKASAGIPDTDFKANFFAKSAPSVTPSRDDKILLGGKWCQVRKVGTDPATALWTLQVYETQAPVDGS